MSKKGNRKMSQQKVRRISRTAIRHANLESHILIDTMVSTDMGNGYEEVWRVNHKGDVESYSMPHGRIPVTGDMLATDVMVSQHELDWFEWLGQPGFDPASGEQIDEPVRYGFGEAAHELALRSPEQHRNDPDRYAGDQQMSKIVLGLTKLGIESGSEVTVLLPVPPSLLSQDSTLARRIRETIKAGEDHQGEGRWSIRLKGDRDWRTFYITRVAVIPEGLGAAYAYRFDINAEPVALNAFHDRIDDMAGWFRIHDGGFGTYDVIDFADGLLNPETLQVATDTRGGIQEHLARPVLAEAKRLTDVRSLTEMHVDAWLRSWAQNGYTEEAAAQYVGGVELRMYNLFMRLCREYADWISREKIGPGWGEGVNAIGLAGGSWMFSHNMIRDKYPARKILHPTLYDHLKWCPVYSLNGFGALVYLSTLLAKKAKA